MARVFSFHYACRIDELATSVEKSLKSIASSLEYYSLSLDENTNVSDIAQLAIFARGVDKDCVITEEMAALVPLKGTTKVIDLLEGVIGILNRLD